MLAANQLLLNCGAQFLALFRSRIACAGHGCVGCCCAVPFGGLSSGATFKCDFFKCKFFSTTRDGKDQTNCSEVDRGPGASSFRGGSKGCEKPLEKKAFEAPNAEQKAAVDAFAAAIDEAKTTTQLYLASPRIFALKYLGDCPHQPSCKHSLRCMQECHAIPPQQRTERDQRLADDSRTNFGILTTVDKKLRPNLVAESELDDEEESFLRRFNCLLHLIADVYVHPFTEEMVDDFVSHFFSYFFSDYYGADVRSQS